MAHDAGEHGTHGPVLAWRRASHLLALLLVATLLAMSQGVVVISQWYGGDLVSLARWGVSPCVIPYLCNIGLFRYIWLVLLGSVVGGVGFALILWRGPLPALEDPKVSWAAVCWPSRPVAFMLGCFVGVQIGVLGPLVAAGALPRPWLWALGIVLLLVAAKLWERERGAGQGLLPLGGWLYVAGYALAMVALAFVGAGNAVAALVVGAASAACVVASLRLGRHEASWVWDGWAKVALLILGLATMGLGAYKLASWRFSVIGDEWAFYLVAMRVLRGTWLQHPLSNLGNYGMHPVLSSYIQAGAMRLWGEDSYGWRISNPLLVAWSLPSLYVIARAMGSRRMALLAAAFLGASYYLMAFGKIGYNNFQALWPLLTSLAIALLALRAGSVYGLLLSGALAGLGFYVFAAGRFALPLVGLVALLYGARAWRRAWTGWAALMLGALAVAGPILLERNVPGVLLEQTIFYSLVSDTWAGRWQQFVANLVRALLAFLWSGKHTHFVFGAHLDPISGLCFVLGLAALVVAARKAKAGWLLGAAFLGGALLFGGLTQYDHPPNTRMFMMVPVYAIIAALGCDAFLDSLGRWAGWRALTGWLSGLVVLAVFAANAYIALHLYEERRPLTQDAMLVGMLQEMALGERPSEPIYLIRNPGDFYDLGAFWLAAYDLSSTRLGVVNLHQAVEALGGEECAGDGEALMLLPSNVEGRPQLVEAALNCARCEISQVRDRSGAYHFEQVRLPACMAPDEVVWLRPWAP